MAHVVDYEDFALLAKRVEAVERENKFLTSLLTAQRWLSRSQAMKAIGCSDDKLARLTKADKLAYRYEGRRPLYDLNSIRTYLTAQKIDANEVDQRVLRACYAEL